MQVAFESLFQEQSQNVQESQLDGQNWSITMGQVSDEKWAIISFLVTNVWS